MPKTPFARWFMPSKLTLNVDAGRVFCPVRRKDVDVDRCMTCSFLNEVVQDDGQLTDVLCSPTFGALVATDL